jgi:hypothetical protein
MNGCLTNSPLLARSAVYWAIGGLACAERGDRSGPRGRSSSKCSRSRSAVRLLVRAKRNSAQVSIAHNCASHARKRTRDPPRQFDARIDRACPIQQIRRPRPPVVTSRSASASASRASLSAADERRFRPPGACGTGTTLVGPSCGISLCMMDTVGPRERARRRWRSGLTRAHQHRYLDASRRSRPIRPGLRPLRPDRSRRTTTASIKPLRQLSSTTTSRPSWDR